MTYLSEVWVDRNEAVRRRLYDTYAWHQAIWDAFPRRDGQERGFLFRVDDKHRRFRVLLLSGERPVIPEWGTWRTREVAPGFLEHDSYLFQLRANPTIKRVVRAEDGTRKRNGRRTPITDETGLLAWLDRKAAQSGFEVLACDIGPRVKLSFTKDHRRGTHVAVDFRGHLRVTDREAFRNAFTKGIGPAKAFGFGLLMLQPVN